MSKLTFSLIVFNCAAITIPTDGLCGSVKLTVDENIRKKPNGKIMGKLNKGTEFEQIDKRGNWVKVKLEGWIWTKSLKLKEEAFCKDFSSNLLRTVTSSSSGRIVTSKKVKEAISGKPTKEEVDEIMLLIEGLKEEMLINNKIAKESLRWV